ncbi:MAG: PAS domain S-box protein, partial [Paucibacter sp.]|nr:PAS domain S-box protein [Roseateles sp.]
MLDAAIARCQALSRQARSQQGEALAQTLAALEAALDQARHALHAPRADSEPLLDDAVLELDLAGYLTGWNDGAQRLFGYSAQEAVGQHVLFLYADDDEDGAIAELVAEPGQARGQPAVTDVRRRTKSGELIWVSIALSLQHDEAGEPLGMLVRLNKVGDPLAEADKLRLHARIIEDSDQGVLITDANERIVSINSAFSRITGYTPAESIGQTPDLLRSGVHDAEFRAKVRAAMRGNGPWRGEIIGKRKNGELFPQSVTISVVRDSAGK